MYISVFQHNGAVHFADEEGFDSSSVLLAEQLSQSGAYNIKAFNFAKYYHVLTLRQMDRANYLSLVAVRNKNSLLFEPKEVVMEEAQKAGWMLV
jgi:hypothetical protein